MLNDTLGRSDGTSVGGDIGGVGEFVGGGAGGLVDGEVGGIVGGEVGGVV